MLRSPSNRVVQQIAPSPNDRPYICRVTIDKETLREKLLEKVRADLEALIRTQNDARDGATHSENRAEHAKDTRATEQSYLARGLADRVEQLRECEARLCQLPLRPLRPFGTNDPIGLTAVAQTRDDLDDDLRTWWLVPVAGGLEIDHDGTTIRTLTPSSPMGQAIMGLREGDEGVFRTPRGERDFLVFRVA